MQTNNPTPTARASWGSPRFRKGLLLLIPLGVGVSVLFYRSINPKPTLHGMWEQLLPYSPHMDIYSKIVYEYQHEGKLVVTTKQKGGAAVTYSTETFRLVGTDIIIYSGIYGEHFDKFLISSNQLQLTPYWPFVDKPEAKRFKRISDFAFRFGNFFDDLWND